MAGKSDSGGVASTAFWTAAARSLENQREDRLLADPWAEKLAGSEGAAWLTGRPPGSTLPIIIRTRYLDDFLLRIASEEGIRQIVLMAAGLDTRAYRLAWPEGMTLYEMEQAPVLAYKERVLTEADARPTCERHAIAADLTAPWEYLLRKAGFIADQPALWLLEGFLFYLPSDQAVRILDGVNALACKGSWLGCDIINSTMLTSPITQPWIEMQAQAGAPWIGAMDDPEGFFGDRGWEVSLTQAGQPDANYGRWAMPVLPTTMPDMPHNWIVTAKKKG